MNLRWYDWRAFGFTTQHATNDGRTSKCGAAVPIDARYLTPSTDPDLRCVNCVRHLKEAAA